MPYVKVLQNESIFHQCTDRCLTTWLSVVVYVPFPGILRSPSACDCPEGEAMTPVPEKSPSKVLFSLNFATFRQWSKKNVSECLYFIILQSPQHETTVSTA